MKIKTALTFAIVLSYVLLNCNTLLGQEEQKRKQDFPLSISLTNHSWAFPFQKIFRISPLYPGLSGETEFNYKSGKFLKFYQTLQIGGFTNKSAGSGLYANTNTGLRYTSSFGIMSDLSIGPGYFHGFYPSQTYTQNAAGSYEKSSRNGVGALSANISIRLGYDFSRKFDSNLSAFIGYQWLASTTYWSLIGIRPNGLLHLGITIHPFH